MERQRVKTQSEIQTPPPGALAQEAPGGGGLLGSPFLFLAAMLLLMWALIIRHKEMLSQIQKGDQVVTSGGLHGRVTGVADDIITVEIADKVRVRVSKSGVSSRSQKSPPEKS
jgi:preprotein translocase subunit YajC